MQFEVEQKFEVSDLEVVQQQLSELGISWTDPVLQVDCYFAHPVRDFAKTDEAMRIRSVGERNFVTYKGPKLDAETKTRREIELPLSDGEHSASQFGELLQILGFRSVLVVRKERRPGKLVWENHAVDVALDTVQHLGTFVELEVSCNAGLVDDAKQSIASLAQKLALTRNQRLSYLELLLLNDE